MRRDVSKISERPLKLGFKGFIFDLDGSLYKGDQPIPGAPEAIKALRQRGRRVLFLTNNSTTSVQGYAERLCAMGIDASPEEILTSAVATAAHMHSMKRGGAFIVGEETLESAIADEGFTILGEGRATEAKYVVCGLDRKVTYSKLAAACLALENGAEFIASNADPRLPAESGYLPGAGAIIDAITATTRMKPKVIGKPTRGIIKMALAKMGLARTDVAVVGDALDMDIRAAKNSGMFSILVLTGVTKKEDLVRAKILPDLTLSSVSDITDML
jgi:4-nitrophenyl phosphatase